jgi:hypothetical protein
VPAAFCTRRVRLVYGLSVLVPLKTARNSVSTVMVVDTVHNPVESVARLANVDHDV